MSLKDLSITKVKRLSLREVKLPAPEIKVEPILVDPHPMEEDLSFMPIDTNLLYPPILRCFKPNSKLYKLEDEFIRTKGGSNRVDIINYLDKVKRQERAPDKAQEDKAEELLKALRDEISGKPVDPERKTKDLQKVIFK